MDKPRRLFLAIKINALLSQSIAVMQNNVPTLPFKINWVKPENFHVTLKFFGMVKPKRQKQIRELMPRMVEGLPPFTLTLQTVGVFPNSQTPHILWIGIHNGEDQLQILHKNIETAVSVIGIPKETRPFHSHLTIGRINPCARIDQPWLEGLNDAMPPWSEKQWVDRLTLFESDLSSGQPIYRVLQEEFIKEERTESSSD